MNESQTSDTSAAPAMQFDPLRFAVERPLATARELAVGFGQLIDGIGDLTGSYVDRVITPGLSVLTISWRDATVPSESWLVDVEEQLRAFGACAGVQVYFRRH